MKQKIKKLAYTIPLDSDYIHDANIRRCQNQCPKQKRQETNSNFYLTQSQ